jgi:hypothetical protein
MSPWLTKRNGTLSYGFHNPDGSWFEVPVPDKAPSAPTSATSSPSGNVRQFLREIASRGGKARAARHGREELAAWGRVRHKPPNR